mmetsp:Transcript_11019/g.44667  ORF Transcript_11019/g.44667 Transcript_11019/m.44667 type:complete len:85 (-) Transcript_11019:27-281(-)
MRCANSFKSQTTAWRFHRERCAAGRGPPTGSPPKPAALRSSTGCGRVVASAGPPRLWCSPASAPAVLLAAAAVTVVPARGGGSE